MVDPKTLASDPLWLPDALDAHRGLIRFARISRDALSAEPFLDQRKNHAVTGWAESRIEEIAPHVPAAPAPSLIFHSAFCGSTLLARALDAPGKVLALKEPNILLDLVNARRVMPAHLSGGRFEQLALIILGLLARPHSDAERVIIKPTNTASPLADFTNAKSYGAIFLYGGLRDFLISLLKKGEEGRVFVRQQYNIFALDGRGLSAIDARKAMGLTDLQTAALVWRHQIEQFERLLKPAVNAKSFDYASMTANPATALRAAARHLSLPLDDADIEKAASGAVFQTNSKFAGQRYDSDKRRAENMAIESRYSAELKLIEEWAAPISLGVEIRLPLSRPLNA